MKDRYWPDSTPEAVFVKGDVPGQYPKQLVGDFLRRYHRAEAAVKQATATADEFQVMREQLSEQCAQLVKSPNKVSEGIYRIVSAHEGFAAQGKKIAMYSDESKTLKWKELEPTANFLFEIKEVGDGEYSIRNMGTDTYIHTLSERYTAVPMSGTHGVNQCIEFLGKDGMVKICNKENSTGYHSAGHNEGAGAAGEIVVWDSSPIVGSGTAWRLEKVSPIK